MNDTDQRSDFERRISQELQASISDWTPECLDPLDLLRLVDDTTTDPAIQAMRSHTATCAYCRREYVQLREALVEAAQLRAMPQNQVPIRTSSEKQKSELNASTVPILPDTENNWTTGIIPWWKSLLFPRAVAAYALVGTCALMLAYLGEVRPLQIQNDRLRLSSAGADSVPDLKLQLAREKEAYLQEKSERSQEHQDAAKQMADLKRVNLHHNEEMKKLAVLLDKSGKTPGVLLSKNDESSLQADKRQMEELMVQSSLAGDNDSTASLLKQITGLSPQGTRIEAPPQGLRWDPVPDAIFYKVSLLPIFADGHSGAFVVQERKIAEAKLPLTQRLKYGQEYEWQVDAYKSQEDTVPISRGTARFAVLEHSQMEKISSLHLQLGTLYLKSGLIGEAIQEWQAIPIESSQHKRAQMHLNTLKSTAFKH